MEAFSAFSGLLVTDVRISRKYEGWLLKVWIFFPNKTSIIPQLSTVGEDKNLRNTTLSKGIILGYVYRPGVMKMNKKCALIVNEDEKETKVIRSILLSVCPGTRVFSVQSGRSALDFLMGSSSETVKDFSTPDVVMVSDSISDVTAAELSEIVSKYYQFRNVKFYLLTQLGNQPEHDLAPPGLHGFFQRPFRNDRATRKKFLAIKPTITTNGIPFATLPALGLLKQKLGGMTGYGVSAGLKAAACLAGAATIYVATVAMEPQAAPSALKAVVLDLESTPPAPVIDPVIPEEPVVTETPAVQEAPAVTATENPAPEVTAAPEVTEQAPDTVRTEKSFSIGVREVRKSTR